MYPDEKLIAIASVASLLLISCSADTISTNSHQVGANDFQTNLSFEEKRAKLLIYRNESEICTSDGGNCMLWTNIMLHCERQMSGETTGYSKPCSSAEEFRERVTGIPLSSSPGAYSF